MCDLSERNVIPRILPDCEDIVKPNADRIPISWEAAVIRRASQFSKFPEVWREREPITHVRVFSGVWNLMEEFRVV